MEGKNLFLARKGYDFYFATENKEPVSEKFSNKRSGVLVIMDLFRQEKVSLRELKLMFNMIVSGSVPVFLITEFENGEIAARQLMDATVAVPDTHRIIENVREIIAKMETFVEGTFPRIYLCDSCGKHGSIMTGPATIRGQDEGIEIELKKEGDFYSKNDAISLVHMIAKQHSWDEHTIKRLVQEIQATALPVNNTQATRH